MIRRFNALGDRVLGALLPKTTAQATSCWIATTLKCSYEECCITPGRNQTDCWWVTISNCS